MAVGVSNFFHNYNNQRIESLNYNRSIKVNFLFQSHSHSKNILNKIKHPLGPLKKGPKIFKKG
jgi:hypothetical protein